MMIFIEIKNIINKKECKYIYNIILLLFILILIKKFN